MIWIGGTLMLAGAALGALSGLGVARLPSTLARIHAAAKPASLGLAMVALGAGVAARSPQLVVVAGLIAVLQFLSAPISGHLLGRSVAAVGPVDLGAGKPGLADETVARRWPLVLLTVVVWVALWRDFSVANLAAGTAIGLIVSLVTGPRRTPSRLDLRRALSTLGVYALSLVKANLRMASQVIRLRRDELVEIVVVCDLETRSRSVAFFDANAISFSPGTLTLEISDAPPYRMVVHALGQDAVEVNAEVADLEESATRMFQ